MKADTEAVEDFKEGVGPGLLIAGVLVGPMAMLIELQVNYALVPWACARPEREWALHAVSLLTLLITIAAGLISWRNWKRTGARWEDEGAGVVPRSRFLSALGILISTLLALVVIAQWIAVFVYGPCQRW